VRGSDGETRSFTFAVLGPAVQASRRTRAELGLGVPRFLPSHRFTTAAAQEGQAAEGEQGQCGAPQEYQVKINLVSYSRSLAFIRG